MFNENIKSIQLFENNNDFRISKILFSSSWRILYMRAEYGQELVLLIKIILGLLAHTLN